MSVVLGAAKGVGVTPRRAAVALIAAYSRGSSAGAMWGRRSLVVHVT